MSIIEFHRSIASELDSVKNRVRNLVKHWPEDGRHKEAILRSVIGKMLPTKYSIGTGFVVKPGAIRNSHKASNQIDIIIYDNQYPVLFREADFVILTPDSVSAIIEVKSNLINANFTAVLDQANQNGAFIYNGSRRANDPNQDFYFPLFNGIFSYDSRFTQSSATTIERAIRHCSSAHIDGDGLSKYAVNHISFNKKYFYKWFNEHPIHEPEHNVYDLEDLSYSFFIANLMHYLSNNSVAENSNLWFPVDKSLQKIGMFSLQPDGAEI